MQMRLQEEGSGTDRTRRAWRFWGKTEGVLARIADELPASGRAERYRRCAAQTLKLAQSTDASEIRATYLSLSQCWQRLAEKADHFAIDDEPELRTH
jgi:hypothetical protein